MFRSHKGGESDRQRKQEKDHRTHEKDHRTQEKDHRTHKHSDRSDKNDKSDRSDKYDKAEKSDRTDRTDRERHRKKVSVGVQCKRNDKPAAAEPGRRMCGYSLANQLRPLAEIKQNLQYGNLMFVEVSIFS